MECAWAPVASRIVDHRGQGAMQMKGNVRAHAHALGALQALAVWARANARPWLWCRGRRSTAPRRPTPSLMTTVRCRPLPLRPGISSSKREVVCCAQAGRTTAHEPPDACCSAAKPRRGIRARGTTQQRYHQHSLSLPGPLPVRTQLIASCPLSPKASGRKQLAEASANLECVVRRAPWRW